LLFEASEEMDINLKESFMVGDRWSDIVAGRSAGCFTIFINRGYAEPLREPPDATVASLADAAKLILSKTQKSRNKEIL
jgi:D-glycero-D-manno-heptose 1,7-bisphosphate phosphatase